MNKIYNLLGFASKSNNLASGAKLMQAIRSNKAKLVLVCSDASANTKKQIFDKCKYYNIDCFEFSNSIELSKAIGKVNRVAVAIVDEGFANSIKNKIKEE